MLYSDSAQIPGSSRSELWVYWKRVKSISYMQGHPICKVQGKVVSSFDPKHRITGALVEISRQCNHQFKLFSYGALIMASVIAHSTSFR